jgi:hypothetical protein
VLWYSLELVIGFQFSNSSVSYSFENGSYLLMVSPLWGFIFIMNRYLILGGSVLFLVLTPIKKRIAIKRIGNQKQLGILVLLIVIIMALIYPFRITYALSFGVSALSLVLSTYVVVKCLEK